MASSQSVNSVSAKRSRRELREVCTVSRNQRRSSACRFPRFQEEKLPDQTNGGRVICTKRILNPEGQKLNQEATGPSGGLGIRLDPPTYPRVPFPDMGGLGGFCVGGFVRGSPPAPPPTPPAPPAPPAFMFWALACRRKHTGNSKKGRREQEVCVKESFGPSEDLLYI